MTNNGQIKQAIDEAQQKIFKRGYADDDVTTKDVMFAAIGYLAEINERRSALIRVEGKVALAVSVVLNIVVGAIYFALTVL